MPSTTICAYKGNISKMLLRCDFADGKNNCLIDNFTIYINVNKITINFIRLNFGKNEQILQKSEGRGMEFGYWVYLYIPKGAIVVFGVTDNNVLAVEDDLIENIKPGDTNMIISSKTTHTNLPKPHGDCVSAFNYSAEASKFKYRRVNCLDYCDVKNMTALNSECKRKCHVECNVVEFPLRIYSFIAEFKEQHINKEKPFISELFNKPNMTNQEVRQGLTHTWIYFDELKTTTYTQIPSMTELDFISSIGGIISNICLASLYFHSI